MGTTTTKEKENKMHDELLTNAAVNLLRFSAFCQEDISGFLLITWDRKFEEGKNASKHFHDLFGEEVGMENAILFAMMDDDYFADRVKAAVENYKLYEEECPELDNPEEEGKK